ncbi:hypothetical protein GXP67_23115 [Rhodocytophaga rosea]|uniref:DUF885 domain-containing protein n=2 Tax=Rhodocytophaga rosea TaxID=2704465 RepID=A0A6C0GXK8_9BACT|nr:hypothetical protein GXP67_23115 [Rhodocytophaga rosea]
MDSIATDYVKLVLQLGNYDADYVDAYYGPEEWRPAPLDSTKKQFPADTFRTQISGLMSQLAEIESTQLAEADKGRYTSLQKQLIAVQAEIDKLSGKTLTFDQEAKAFYDATPPTYTEAHFQGLIAELDKALPGKGDITTRLNKFKESFIIPKEKLDTVFKAAIAEARKRTLQHIKLPANENFTVEYVTNKSWSGYNWYKGNSYSLIQVNTDLPIYIDRAIDLACHEGYPGHHVYNALMEKHLVRDKGWVEFSVYPLFSPQSLIAEGSANYGIDVAFPGNERIAFEKNVLFPLAGLDPAKVESYYQIQDLTKGLSYAGNEAARQYLDGKINKEAAVNWMVKYALMAPERATQRIGFIEKYRSYVINYNLGQDMVASFIEKKGGTTANPQKRWTLFEELLSQPHVPSQLQ